MKDQFFPITAVLDKQGNYNNFGIHNITAALYGYKPEDILSINLKIAENQNKPQTEDHLDPNIDYWGWFNNEQNNFIIIHQKLFLLNMCFAYGFQAEEDRNRGKAYRLEIIK